ncbi:DUF2637 domain-containing protein [Streptomyces sp. NPDC058268]|uniref:DUF2637 domain-containing protein n=1 Tax=Streptomyces sp. NPDC058268 TaxID=3346413 RepID=UPI0036E5DB03
MDDWHHGGESTYISRYPRRPEHDTLGPYDSVPVPAQQSWDGVGLDATLSRRGLEEELAEMLSTTSRPRLFPEHADHPLSREELADMLTAVSGPKPPPEPADQPLSRIERRRMRQKPQFLVAGQRITQVTVLFAVIAVCAACLLGWSITYTYGQLRTIAEYVLPVELAQWWPLTVYGPWFVAALSVLRATVQHQTARRSWGVLLVTSAMAVALCVSHSSHSVLAFVTLGIPPITALVCFWELIGQLSSKHRTRAGAHAQQRSKA